MAKKTGTSPGLIDNSGVSISHLRGCIEPLGKRLQHGLLPDMPHDSTTGQKEGMDLTPSIQMSVEVQYSDWTPIDLIKCSESWQSNAMISPQCK